MENKQVSASALIDGMVKLTLTRHAKLSNEEYEKEIGVKADDILFAKFNLLDGITKEMLKANDKVKLIDATFKAIFDIKGE